MIITAARVPAIATASAANKPLLSLFFVGLLVFVPRGMQSDGACVIKTAFTSSNHTSPEASAL